MNFFITFEGIEGCGKTTQLRLLTQQLRHLGRDVVTTREPGGCPIADAIRNILLDPGNHNLAARAELLLYAAARAQHIDEVIRPALRDGKMVLCDRFTDATIAYQGYGRGLDRELIASLNALASAGTMPDLTILLDMPAEEGLQRARSRNTTQTLEHEGRFEQESLEFHRRVRQGYLDLAQREKRILVIDAMGPPESVSERIFKALEPKLFPERCS